jgi:TonB family protein
LFKHGLAGMETPLPMSTGRFAGIDVAIRLHVAAALLFVLALWPQVGHPISILSETIKPAPRVLSHPTSQTVAEGSCPDEGAPPMTDEDRSLVTGGQRTFTGRSQRKGNTYVAEATSHPIGSCADTTVQLYLFRDGKFVGAATPYSLPSKQAHFESFTLVDPVHLRYVVADSTSTDTRCARTRSRRPEATTTLMLGAQGWTLRMDPYANVSYQARQPLRYPREPNGHLNEGKVVVHATVDKDGFPADIRITRGSSHPELDQAAIEYVRRNCFNPAESSVDVPVNFSVHKL